MVWWWLWAYGARNPFLMETKQSVPTRLGSLSWWWWRRLVQCDCDDGGGGVRLLLFPFSFFFLLAVLVHNQRSSGSGAETKLNLHQLVDGIGGGKWT